MKTNKLMSGLMIVLFGCVVSAQAAYMLAMDEDSQAFTLNVFDSVSGDRIQQYTTLLPEETENIVYAGYNTLGENVAYGIQSYNGNSSLYKFILDDASSTVTYSSLGSVSGISGFDSIALNGDMLYTVSRDKDRLYSVDLASNTFGFTEVMKLNGQNKAKDVQALTYGNGQLYGFDTDKNTLFSIDLTSKTLTTIASTVQGGIEGLAFVDDGAGGMLYAGYKDDLYQFTTTGSQIGGAVSLTGWATDIEGLSFYSSGASVPEPASVMVWLLAVGGAGYSVRRKRALA